MEDPSAIAPPGPEPAARRAWEHQYKTALLDYLRHPVEPALARARALGRRALAEGLTVPEIARIHRRSLRALPSKSVWKSANPASRPQPPATERFIAEFLSPFEAAHQQRRRNQDPEPPAPQILDGLFDEIGQLLVGLHLVLKALARGPFGSCQCIETAIDLLDQVDAQLRQFNDRLRPTVLEQFGLGPAIQSLAQSLCTAPTVAVSVEVALAERLAPDLEAALYRFVEEALANLVAHARPSRIEVRLWCQDDTVLCSIRDDGPEGDVPGMRVNAMARSLGLRALRDRVEGFGGELLIGSSPSGGTEILVRVATHYGNSQSWAAAN